MNDLSQKVFPEFRPPVSLFGPIEGRKYTVTHSDETGHIMVTVALDYAEDLVGPMRDEVRLAWQRQGGQWVLMGEVLVDDGKFSDKADMRFEIFKREMPKALQAVRYAEDKLFEADPNLDEAPIKIQFVAIEPAYNQLLNFGKIGDYRE